MIRYFSVLFCFFFYCNSIISQNEVDTLVQDQFFTISGIIQDTDNEFVPYASVIFTNLESLGEVGAVSDKKGFFTTELVPGPYIMEIRSLTFVTYSKEIIVEKEFQFTPVILKKKVEELDEVRITSEISRSIEHKATGMTINIQNDSLFKKISALDILEFLPGIRVKESGEISLNGVPAMITLNGKSKKMSPEILKILLEGITGDNLRIIELINNPPAKYSGTVKKVININLREDRDDGISGVISSRYSNSDFAIYPSTGINYKADKLVLSFSSLPYSFSKRTSTKHSLRQNMRDNFSFDEIEIYDRQTFRFNHMFSADYTINDKNSVLFSLDWKNDKTTNEVDFKSNQLSQNILERKYIDRNSVRMYSESYNIDLSYRYDINKDKTRLDIAGSYGSFKLNENDFFKGKSIKISDNTESISINRNNKTENNILISGRADYKTLLGQNKNEFEMGLKLDHVFIQDKNEFEEYNFTTESFEGNRDFTSDFDYRENIISGYSSLNANKDRFKYSAGLRFEYIRTISLSNVSGQSTKNTYFNVLPVVSLKYMTNESQTSDINMSYRKGYSLPPYIQLNSYKNYINSTTIRRGNPYLTQSIFHLISVGFNFKNKYSLTLSSNYYTDLIEVSEVFENNINVISYQNIGDRSLYTLNFNSSTRFWDWWRLSYSAAYYLTKVKGSKVDSKMYTYSLGINNSWLLGKNWIIGFNTDLNNGDYGSYGISNRFIRIYSTASLSKKFLSDKLSIRAQVLDIFGVNNRNQKKYIVGNTSYLTRTTLQRPLLTFSASYRFATGKKISKKNKKTSNVDSSRF